MADARGGQASWIQSAEQALQRYGIRLDRSGRSTLVLLGQTGMYKSSTGNNLCGVDNPGPDLSDEELAAARSELPFENTPCNDEAGSSCTTDCIGRMGERYYVIDTPGFGDTSAGTDEALLEAQDYRTAQAIDAYIRAENRQNSICGCALFVPHDLVRRHVWLQMLFKHLLRSFGNPQRLLDTLILAQPVIQQCDVVSKATLARRSRAMVRNMLVNNVLPDLGMTHLHVPDELPYAFFCPFSDSKAGGSVRLTINAFVQAVDMVNANARLRQQHAEHARTRGTQSAAHSDHRQRAVGQLSQQEFRPNTHARRPEQSSLGQNSRPEREPLSRSDHRAGGVSAPEVVSSRESERVAAQTAQPQQASPSSPPNGGSGADSNPLSFPPEKCRHCSYDQRRADHRSSPLAGKCHPRIRVFETWHKILGTVTTVFPGFFIPLFVPDAIWPKFWSDDAYCSKCREPCQTDGCTEGAPHVYT